MPRGWDRKEVAGLLALCGTPLLSVLDSFPVPVGSHPALGAPARRPSASQLQVPRTSFRWSQAQRKLGAGGGRPRPKASVTILHS